ncbi:MAG: hypothetical protein H6739_11870 [Alphaproteobacteria bacterium]|nr:hypothetical protein [Alphaproteobacteria bacterium]
MRLTLLPLVFALGCVEYGLEKYNDNVEPAVDSGWQETALDPDPDTGADTGPQEDPNNEDPPVGCDQFELTPWSWWGSPPFDGPDDPTDGAGVPFYEPAAAVEGWSGVTLPDRNIPVHNDRVYRADVTLDRLPPALHLSLQSDDGIWLWVNGAFVGHWGGGWQEEGCVNENAQCLVTVSVDDLDITEHLVEGPNTIAARVSNPVANAWFEVIPYCVESE